MSITRHAGLLLTLLSGAASPRIILSGTTISEEAVGGDPVGTLSVRNGSGTYTFSITADPDSKFDLDGVDNTLLEVEALATFDYGVAQTHTVTIEADNGVDAVLTETFVIFVQQVGGAETASLYWFLPVFGRAA